MAYDLSEYERQRLEHIKRNHEMLVRLGLASADAPPTSGGGGKAAPARPKGPRRRTVAAIAPESLRRSGRNRGATAEYGSETIDQHGEELDRKAAKRARPDRASDDGSGADEEVMMREVLESTTAFLRESRLVLLQFVSSDDGEAPADALGWREEATKRWGELAGAAAPKSGGGSAGRDWEKFVRSRLSTPPPLSPHDLLQEYYAHDPWQLLCVCVLMSRVSSWDTKHRCISGFFEEYTTPSLFASSVVNTGETAELRALINSLGLFDERLKSLTAITTAFLAGEDTFEVGLAPPHKIHGVGQFGVHSFQIFARDQGASLKPTDAALVTYCNWRRKYAVELAKAEAAGTEAAAPAVDSKPCAE